MLSRYEGNLKSLLRLVPFVALLTLVIGSWILVLSGGLSAVFAWVLLLPLVVPGLSALALVIAAYRLLRHRKLTPVLALTLLVSLVGLWPGAWLFGTMQIAFPADAKSTTPSIVARLPTKVPLVAYWGGDKIDGNYHAVAADQRWAYDFVVPPAATDSANLKDYGCYGVDVVAPIAGKVVAAHDAEPDAVPAQPPNNPLKPLGNHVAIETEHGTFVLLAHLQPGSVAVKEGERVEEGRLLGRCGNSGNTSEPHIHVHHQRQDPRKFPVGFAEGLPLYFLVDGAPQMPAGGVRVEGKSTVLLGKTLVPPEN